MKKLEKHHVTKRLLVLLCVAIATLFTAGQAFAAVGGGCVDCHTMHNSQGNVAIDATGPNAALLNKGTCVGCHADSGAPANSETSTTPQVDGIAGETLAAGSFYWMQTTETMGHNVKQLDIDGDGTLTNPPGWNATAYVANDKVNNGAADWVAGTLTCAGTTGCHGNHELDGAPVTDEFIAVKGGHHDTAGTAVLGYRMLNGIAGVEDDDWEFETGTDHNIYEGQARDASSPPNANTISYLCAECHGDYHSAAGISTSSNMSSPWLRHPTDIDMAADGYAGTEYDSYAYNTEAPVAVYNSTSLTSTSTPDTTQAGNAIVTCVSCHRAHGSDQPDLLRWTYANMQAGNGGAATGTGCFRCHTEKD